MHRFRAIPLLLLTGFLFHVSSSAQEIPLRPEEWRPAGAELLPDGTVRGTDEKQNYGGVIKTVVMDQDKAPILVIETEQPSAGWYVILGSPQLEKGQKHLQGDTTKEGEIHLDVARISGLTGRQEFTLNVGVVRTGSPDPVKGVTMVCKGLRMAPREDTRPPLVRKVFPELAGAHPLFVCDKYSVFPDRVEGPSGSAGISPDGKQLLSDFGGILRKTVPGVAGGLPSV